MEFYIARTRYYRTYVNLMLKNNLFSVDFDCNDFNIPIYLWLSVECNWATVELAQTRTLKYNRIDIFNIVIALENFNKPRAKNWLKYQVFA